MRRPGRQFGRRQFGRRQFGHDRAIAQRCRECLKAAVIGLLCLQLLACSTLAIPASATEQITVTALAAEIEQGRGPLILDVRSPEEYAEGHIPGAVNIPFRDVPNQLDTIRQLSRESRENTDEPGTVIVYCERGVRANVAEHALIDAGFPTTLQLTGHMAAWRDGNLPVEKGS